MFRSLPFICRSRGSTSGAICLHWSPPALVPRAAGSPQRPNSCHYVSFRGRDQMMTFGSSQGYPDHLGMGSPLFCLRMAGRARAGFVGVLKASKMPIAVAPVAGLTQRPCPGTSVVGDSGALQCYSVCESSDCIPTWKVLILYLDCLRHLTEDSFISISPTDHRAGKRSSRAPAMMHNRCFLFTSLSCTTINLKQ